MTKSKNLLIFMKLYGQVVRIYFNILVRGSSLMADFDHLTEKVTSLQTKVSRLEFAVLFMMVIMFLLFSLSIYIRR